MEIAPVAVYRRTVTASLARVWENVLDWEHLPWLHRTTFRYVRLLDWKTDQYRVESALVGPKAKPFVIEVTLDRANRLYHNRTIEGAGTGSDIVTRLDPIAPHETGIHVEFLVPGVPPERVLVVAAMYERLYERLWNEDQGMMMRRQRVVDAGARRASNGRDPVTLGAVADVRARLPLVIEAHGERIRVVDVHGTLVAHPTTCPHLGGPLEEVPVDDGCVTCPWHGYRFDLRTGRSVDDRGLHLDHAPRVETSDDGSCRLTWA